MLDVGARASRDPFKGQGDDVKWGQEEIEAARQRNALPQQVDEPVIAEYINRLAINLARNRSTDSVKRPGGAAGPEERWQPRSGQGGQPSADCECNGAPGGFLYVYAGLILDAENESELAGVIAHEISHNAARHAHRLQDKGRTFGIIQLATLIGLQVFVPGLFQAATSLGFMIRAAAARTDAEPEEIPESETQPDKRKQEGPTTEESLNGISRLIVNPRTWWGRG